MAVYLQEKCDLEKKIVAKLDPASQLLFFYFIYMGQDLWKQVKL